MWQFQKNFVLQSIFHSVKEFSVALKESTKLGWSAFIVEQWMILSVEGIVQSGFAFIPFWWTIEIGIE